MASLEQYGDQIRKLLSEKGSVVEIDERAQARYPNDPDSWVGTYGWADHDAIYHIRDARHGNIPCPLVIPQGVTLTEVSYSEFCDTYTDNKIEVGVNAYGGPKGESSEIRCSCGEYRGLTLRYNGSLGDFLRFIMGVDRNEGLTI